MTTVIRGGVVVTADRTWDADFLVDREKIIVVGPDLKGDRVVGAQGAYVMAGASIRIHASKCPSWARPAPRCSRAVRQQRPPGGTTMIVDFVLPGPDGSVVNAIRDWHREAHGKICIDVGWHVAVTRWNETIWREMAEVVTMGANTFNHFMAYKGPFMLEGDEMYTPFTWGAERRAWRLRAATGISSRQSCSVSLERHQFAALHREISAEHSERRVRHAKPN